MMVKLRTIDGPIASLIVVMGWELTLSQWIGLVYVNFWRSWWFSCRRVVSVVMGVC